MNSKNEDLTINYGRPNNTNIDKRTCLALKIHTVINS